MKTTDFLRDKAFFTVIMLFTVIFESAVLLAFNISTYLVSMLFSLHVMGMCGALAYEYMKKCRFYSNVVERSEAIDKKHLISEMVFRPTFMEGEIFYDVLQMANKSMNDEISRYKTLSEEYKEYIETWVHEVKTPISSSRLIIENNRNDVTSSLLEELDRIDRFVEQALYYSKISNMENDYIIKRLNLEQMVNDSIRRHSKVLIENRAGISKENLSGLHVYADIKWIRFVLGQIIENAVKYKGEDFKIRFCAREEEAGTVLSIKDNGMGITQKDIGKVFEKGFTGENGRISRKSTGIGLYLCRKLCRKMGLKIDIESSVGEGTTVDIYFPQNKMLQFEES
ncbi:Signal transduction histidine kinase [Peptoclostridium litorale DSM 5388]|uniref:histidine kinase n=1 Tax=Peptoclostridium litorale DSM 5388 TaxID=1121324 RepID=A0A069RF33_PEPLI|nr:sensor histidine kinase [Peptoclostridium litorale]KDR95629.1 ATPase/histidine kinase/DNA gyrase [Peptoclostridium litorale DSM 5388]SIN99780.1 Signal transduction histidine kinase [Peptoclostridium litorale DSM 5388]